MLFPGINHLEWMKSKLNIKQYLLQQNLKYFIQDKKQAHQNWVFWNHSERSAQAV